MLFSTFPPTDGEASKGATGSGFGLGMAVKRTTFTFSTGNAGVTAAILQGKENSSTISGVAYGPFASSGGETCLQWGETPYRRLHVPELPVCRRTRHL
jgi:hypothetical protein